MNPPTLPLLSNPRRAWAIGGFALACFASAANSFAAPPKETGVPSYSVFEPSIAGTERGVNSLRIDALGRLLVATGPDLAAYDGRVWTKYRQERGARENLPIVMDTAVGGDGRLYAATDYGLFEVRHLPGDRFELADAVENESEDWPAYFYFNRLMPVEGAIYGIGAAHLARFDLATRSLELLTDRRDYGISHFALAPADGGMYLFNSIGGLWRRRAAEWEQIRPPGDPAEMRIVRSSLVDAAGRLFVGTEDAGIVELADGQLRPRRTEIDEVGTPPVIDMAAMDGGRVAVSMLGFGVAMLDERGNFAQVMSRSLDYRFAETTHLLYAGNGVVWAALENSVARIQFMDPLSEYARYAQHALPFPRFERHGGRMHLITDYRLLGAEYFEGGALKGFAERPLPEGEKLNYFLSTPGGLLCATDKRVFFLGDDDSVAPVREHGDTFMMAPIGGSDDLVACASLTEYFLLRRGADGAWRLEGEPLPAPGMSHEVVEARDGSVWIEHGLGCIARLRLVEGRLEARVFREADGVGSSWINIWSVGGEIYASKAAGVFLRWDARSEVFEPDDGLLTEMAKHFSGPTKGAVDARGNVWVPATAGHGILYDRGGGKFEADFESLRAIHDEYIHKMWIGDSGDVWMRGRNFVARYDPAYEKPRPELAAPTIYRVELVERKEALLDARGPGGARRLDLAHADNSLRFHFAYPILNYGRALRFECFLEGMSKDWIDVGQEESIVFSNVPAGKYRLRVRSTFDGAAYSPAAALAFSISPPVFRSPWAYAAYALLLVALVYLVVSRMRALEKRKTLRLQRLVELRTRELDAANGELRLMYDKAEAGNRAKSAFIAMISHEMRTPLNAIIGPSSVLRDELAGGSERHQRMLALIHGSAKHLLSLINDILSFSGKESKSTPPARARFDLDLLLEELLDAFAPKAQAKGLELEGRRAPDLPSFWIGDATRLRQILINLLDNAIKCTDSGRVELRAEREHGPRGETFLRATVLDTGIGVREAEAARIFDPFVQGSGAPDRPHEGTGLGLAICKQLVGHLDGEIGLERGTAGGSAFWFRVPMEVAPEQEEARAGESWTPGEFASCRALVAEDNAENRYVMEIALAKLGCSFRFACDGEAALQALKEEPFDVAFLDLRMPRLDGIGAARAIRASAPPAGELPLIALSAYLSDEVKARCAQAGFDGFIDKPAQIADIAGALRRALADRAAPARG